MKGIPCLREWSYTAGILVLTAAEVVFLLIFGSAIGLTAALAGISPSWTLRVAAGLSPLPRALAGQAGLLLDLSIVVGAFIAAKWAGELAFRQPVGRPGLLIKALLGGALMGIGARLAPGCNIGGVVGGIASHSLQGWVEGFSMVAGIYLGTRLFIRRGNQQ
ncbi:MAG TPA: YeeE/YedE thiosulfate transporter family protein [Bacillota bacterium]|jgi:hypothetical protein